MTGAYTLVDTGKNPKKVTLILTLILTLTLTLILILILTLRRSQS